MKFSATYEITPKLQDDSAKQYFWSILLRPRMGAILAFLALLPGMIFLEFPYKPWIVGFFSAAVLFLVIVWVRAYFQIIAMARAGLNLMEHPRVEILLDEALIEYVSSTGTRRHQWEKIGEIQETEDFVILVNGKLPLLSLPKACFSSEALTFMKEKCRAGRHC